MPSLAMILAEPRDLADPPQQLGGGHQLTGLDGAALLELGQQAGQVQRRPAGPGTCRRSPGGAGAPSTSSSRPSSLTSNSTLPRSVLTTTRQVADPGDRRLGRRPARAARRTARTPATVSARGDGEPRGDPGARVHRRRLADQPGEPGDAPPPGAPAAPRRRRPGSASCRIRASSSSRRQRVVGADLRAEPVLQRGDDPAPVGVVLRVGAGHQQQVQRQPQRVAADLPMSRSSSTFSSATWIRSARSGSSLRQKMPRLVRGTSPKWIVSGSPRVRPSATLIGSMSPIRSPTLVSGVASFSPYRSLRCRQLTGRSSPSSAARRRQRAQTGA